MKALLDLDIVCYRVGFACQKKKYKIYLQGAEEFGPVEIYSSKKEIAEEYLQAPFFIEQEIMVEPLANCLHSVKVLIESMLVKTGAKSYIGYLTGKGNFREKIATIQPYKGNRDKDAKPFWYNEIREYLINKYKAIVVDGIEADDALGIEQTKEQLAGEVYANTIICSIDKDLDMIPGWHYNFIYDRKYFIDEHEAIRNFYTQVLTGDTTDNIRGLRGIGPKKAYDILKDCSTELDMYNKVKAMYNNDREFEETCNLIWIKRHQDKGWAPPVS